MLITDAQIHIWEVDRPDRPWPAEVRNPPHRPNGFSAEEALAEMDAAGVNRAIIVPPTWAGENNATAIEASARYPARFAVMGRFDPRTANAHAQLEGWLDQPQMLGIRMTLRLKPFVDWLDDGTLDWFWEDCAALRIPVMVLVPGMARKIHAVAERIQGLTLIIDHMARLLDVSGPEVFADLDDLLALAAFPNVLVKVTSVPNFSTEPYPFRDVQPHLRRIYDAFGARRMLWGADLTRLAGSYRQCLDLFKDAMDFLSSEDREWVLGKAAAEALNWPE